MEKHLYHPVKEHLQSITFVTEDRKEKYTVNTDVKDMISFFAEDYRIEILSNGNFILCACNILEKIMYYYASKQQDLLVEIPIELIRNTLFPGNDQTSKTNKAIITIHLLKGISNTKDQETKITYLRDPRYFRERNLANMYYLRHSDSYVILQQERNSVAKDNVLSLILVPAIGELILHSVQVTNESYQEENLKGVVAQHMDVESNFVKTIFQYSIYQSDLQVTHDRVTYPPNGIVLISTEEKNILIYHSDGELKAKLVDIRLAYMYQFFFKRSFPFKEESIINYTDDDDPFLYLEQLPSDSTVYLLQNFRHCNIKAQFAYLVEIQKCHAIILFSDAIPSLQIVSEEYYQNVSGAAGVLIKDGNRYRKSNCSNAGGIELERIEPCINCVSNSESWGIEHNVNCATSKESLHEGKELSNWDYCLCCGMVFLLASILLISIYIVKSHSTVSKTISIVLLCVSSFFLSISSIYLVSKIKTNLEQMAEQQSTTVKTSNDIDKPEAHDINKGI